MPKKPSLACALLASLTAGALPAAAATFTVSEGAWGTITTPNSFAWAIHQANTTPGHDTINVLTNVDVDNYMGTPSQPFEVAVITDPDGVTIQGNGKSLIGNPSYINTSGQVITKYNPAQFSSGDILTLTPHDFARIADNVNNVFINNLNADGLNQFLAIGKGSTVSVKGSTIRNAGAFGMRKPPIFSVFDNSTLNLEGINLKDINRFDELVTGFEYSWSAIIAGTNAVLNLDRSLLDLYTSATTGALRWTGGTANVVSSIILGKGLSIADDAQQGVLNVVNSIFRPYDHSGTARIQAFNGGEANLTASTIQYDASYTTDVPSPSDPFSTCPDSYLCNGAPLQAFANGTIKLNTTAVDILSTDAARIQNPYANTWNSTNGSLEADALSYVRTATNLDSAALKSLFNQPNLKTTGTPYAYAPDPGNPSASVFVDLPSGGNPLAPGPLHAAVPDANTTNRLINPIDGSVISTDVFGNPRTFHGRRDIGAVQTSYAPGPLPLLGCGAALGWSRRLRRRLQSTP